MKKLYVFLVGLFGLMFAGFASAAASGVPYTTLTGTLSTEVTNAVTGALPVAGLVLSGFIGYRIYKHFVRG
jgi:hypothetical protein